jgi:acyl carrier protein
MMDSPTRELSGPAPSTASPTVNEIIETVIRLLAEERGQPSEVVRAELEAAGTELPIDSLRLMEILTRVEQEFGVEVPPDLNSARSMCSIRAFAELIQTACTTANRIPS